MSNHQLPKIDIAVPVECISLCQSPRCLTITPSPKSQLRYKSFDDETEHTPTSVSSSFNKKIGRISMLKKWLSTKGKNTTKVDGQEDDESIAITDSVTTEKSSKRSFHRFTKMKRKKEENIQNNTPIVNINKDVKLDVSVQQETSECEETATELTSSESSIILSPNSITDTSCTTTESNAENDIQSSKSSSLLLSNSTVPNQLRLDAFLEQFSSSQQIVPPSPYHHQQVHYHISHMNTPRPPTIVEHLRQASIGSSISGYDTDDNISCCSSSSSKQIVTPTITTTKATTTTIISTRPKHQRVVSTGSISSNHSTRSIKTHQSCRSIYSSTSHGSTTTSTTSTTTSSKFAKPSQRIRKCSQNYKLCHLEGDGEIWIEKLFASSRNKNKTRIYFVSVMTGKRVRYEPPTGASKVVYRNDCDYLHYDISCFYKTDDENYMNSNNSNDVSVSSESTRQQEEIEEESTSTITEIVENSNSVIPRVISYTK